MIQVLLQTLQNEFQTQFPEFQQVILGDPSLIDPALLPALALQPGKLEIQPPKAPTRESLETDPTLSLYHHFQQEFLIHVLAVDLATLEKWSILPVSLILSTQKSLLNTCNIDPQKQVSSTNYAAEPTLEQLQFPEGIPDLTTGQFKSKLRFLVKGQLKITYPNTQIPETIDEILY